jgi:hypothetical protein
MYIPACVRRRLRLPSKIALLLGLGALSLGVHGEISQDREFEGVGAVPQADRIGLGELSVRMEDGRVYVAEAGKAFELLNLGETPEALVLKQVLATSPAASAPAGMRLRPTILAGGGGQGYHWTRVPVPPAADGPAGSSGADQTSARNGSLPPGQAGPGSKPPASENN